MALGVQMGKTVIVVADRPGFYTSRVLGVMIGAELSIDGGPVVKACMDRKLLINCTHGTVLRLLPALNLTEQQAHEGCDILAEALKEQA